MKYLLYTITLFLGTLYSHAQNHQSRFESIDVQHYSFEIHLNDSTNRIEGKATVLFKLLKPTENCIFDLAITNGQNNGMSVETINLNNESVDFTHKKNQIEIALGNTFDSGSLIELEIKYAGVPIDGLVISENKYSERTFFGDNWPDRAKHWLPCVDHPSDKATLEFEVYAPAHYKVISNGKLIEQQTLANNTVFTHWKQSVPISTKLMVIGVADFTIGNKLKYDNIPVSSWVFSKNAEQGFKNYKYGTEALEYFSELIGPYSYEKLAHVQSKTRYGGMENASCIFYHERTATSERSQEGLFAHEVAHQWFGNSVTEQNWHHVWLSEGFATYLTHIYKQKFHGEEVFCEGLKRDRERVIKYAKQNLAPIIDTTVTDYIQLLNANSYQKASWVLHMLHEKLGDDLFFKGLQNYYAEFKDSSALTNDFQAIMEDVSGIHLDAFFKQWLWQAGHPVLDLEWTQTPDELTMHIRQVQENTLFEFPVDIEILFADGSTELKTVWMLNSGTSKKILTNKRVKEIVLDPHTKLLFELN